MDIKLDASHLKGFIKDKDFETLIPAVRRAHNNLVNKTGKGAEFTGWIDLPSHTEDRFLREIDDLGKQIREGSDALLSVGIGGSYLGIHASLEFLIGEQKIPVYFAGHNLSSGYLYHLLREIENKKITLVVISNQGQRRSRLWLCASLKNLCRKNIPRKNSRKESFVLPMRERERCGR